MEETNSYNSIDTNPKNPENNQINLIKEEKDIEYEIIYKNFIDDEEEIDFCEQGDIFSDEEDNYSENKNKSDEEFKVKKKLKLFDQFFINNNEDKCTIIYKDQVYKLKEYLEDIDKDYEHSSEKEIKIKLKINKDITNISYMFHTCDRLLYVKDVQKKNYPNINNLDLKMNSEHNKISEEDSQKAHFIGKGENNIFNKNNWIDQDNSMPSSISLRKDNNISDTNKMIDVNFTNDYQFYNNTDMSGIFKGCSSLISLPDISKWNT